MHWITIYNTLSEGTPPPFSHPDDNYYSDDNYETDYSYFASQGDFEGNSTHYHGRHQGSPYQRFQVELLPDKPSRRWAVGVIEVHNVLPQAVCHQVLVAETTKSIDMIIQVWAVGGSGIKQPLVIVVKLIIAAECRPSAIMGPKKSH